MVLLYHQPILPNNHLPNKTPLFSTNENETYEMKMVNIIVIGNIINILLSPVILSFTQIINAVVNAS